jgi:di/tricarboxylate transporter
MSGDTLFVFGLRVVIMAVIAAIFTRRLTMEDAYRAIPWSSIVLVVGMLPLTYVATLFIAPMLFPYSL